MSQVVQTTSAQHSPNKKGASRYSFVNVARSILTVASTTAFPIVVATKLSDGQVLTWHLIALAGVGVVAGGFVAFQLYLTNKSR